MTDANKPDDHTALIFSVGATRRGLLRNEYAPVPVHNANQPIKDAGKRPKGSDWNVSAKLLLQSRAEPHEPDTDALNTGILCDGLRPIDIDIDNPDLAIHVKALALQIFGQTIIRDRSDGSARALYLYRAAEGEPRKRQMVGKWGKVEILGRGQQFVAFGQHPSGSIYEWSPAGPDIVVRSSLLAISEAQVTDFLTELAALTGAEKEVPPGASDTSPRQVAELAPPSAAAVVDIFNRMPNPAAVDRDTYVSVMLSAVGCIEGLRSTTGLNGDDEYDIGQAACEWAARWEGGSPGIEFERDKWDSDWSVRTRPLAGWPTLQRHAAALIPDYMPYQASSILDGVNISQPPSGLQAEVAPLAALSPFEYDRVRQSEANRLGVRVGTLDKQVEAARVGSDDKQGRALVRSLPEPWPEPVNGAMLLNSLAHFYARHAVLPLGVPVLMAIWAVHTYVYEIFRHTPRLAILSPEKGCGKSTVLELLRMTVRRPLSAAHITAPVAFRIVESATPTLLVDEADTFLRHSEELRGVLDSGHQRGGQVWRCVGDDFEVRAFSTFAPAAIAAIGGLPGTIMDRSIVIQMRRAHRQERPQRIDAATEQEGDRLGRQIVRWIMDHNNELQSASPALPDELANREADNWRPIFAIAEVAGGDWPKMAIEIQANLRRDSSEGREGDGVTLLSDIRSIFEQDVSDRLFSSVICFHLARQEDRPWGEYGRKGVPITPMMLARLLLPFRIHPKNFRQGGGSDSILKGYARSDFEDAWARYLSSE